MMPVDVTKTVLEPVRKLVDVALREMLTARGETVHPEADLEISKITLSLFAEPAIEVQWWDAGDDRFTEFPLWYLFNLDAARELEVQARLDAEAVERAREAARQQRERDLRLAQYIVLRHEFQADEDATLTQCRAQLRHLYQQMVEGHVHDVQQAAEGLLGPTIAKLEELENKP